MSSATDMVVAGCISNRHVCSWQQYKVNSAWKASPTWLLSCTCRLGDTVRVTGWCEQQADHPALRAVSVQVTQPWRQQHPDAGFIPRPAPKVHQHQPQHAHTPQHQQNPAQQAQQPEDRTGQQQQPDSMQSAGDPVCVPTADAVNTPSGTAAAGTDGPVVQAARVTSPQVSVCKFWVNTGRCAKGAQCPFLHTLLPAAGGVSRKNWLQKRYVVPQNLANTLRLAVAMRSGCPGGTGFGEAPPRGY